MAKQPEYIKIFKSENEATDWMVMKNQTHKKGNGFIFALVDGPNNDFAVVDLSTAIELGNGYKISYN